LYGGNKENEGFHFASGGRKGGRYNGGSGIKILDRLKRGD
jgi:hypothetical protein